MWVIAGTRCTFETLEFYDFFFFFFGSSDHGWVIAFVLLLV